MAIKTNKFDEIKQLKVANNQQIWQFKTSKSDGIAFFIITGM